MTDRISIKRTFSVAIIITLERCLTDPLSLSRIYWPLFLSIIFYFGNIIEVTTSENYLKKKKN